MKKLLFLALISIASVTAFSQAAPSKDRFANLNLTEQQKASVDSVRKIYDAQRAAVKNDAAVTDEAKKEKMKEIRKEQTKAINTILTDDQKKQLKKEDEEKKKKTDN